jgi:hypothetical protein
VISFTGARHMHTLWKTNTRSPYNPNASAKTRIKIMPTESQSFERKKRTPPSLPPGYVPTLEDLRPRPSAVASADSTSSANREPSTGDKDTDDKKNNKDKDLRSLSTALHKSILSVKCKFISISHDR